MKIINFGSLNIDYVYRVDHFVMAGESEQAMQRQIHAGGKGLNQSIAAARAGAQVVHAGALGPDGAFLQQLLCEAGVDASMLLHVEQPTGHAIIQVTPAGENAIVAFGGANQQLTQAYVDSVLDRANAQDWVLLQHETSCTAYIIEQAAQRGLRVAFNPSPFPSHPESLPLEGVHTFIVNELEGAQLAGLPPHADENTIMAAIVKKYPAAQIIMTLGGRGVVALLDGQKYMQPAFSVQAVDTTAAGDTFCGYYLAACCGQQAPEQCLRLACAASAIAITRAGAAPSIPTMDETLRFLQQK